MTPILIVEWRKLPSNMQLAVPHMARTLEDIAEALASGEGGGHGPTYSWHVETDVTLDEIRAAIGKVKR